MKAVPSLLFMALTFAGLAASPAAEPEFKPTNWLEDNSGWQLTKGEEFAGAEGELKFEEVEGKPAAVLVYNFEAGGAYVAAGYMRADQDFSRISIKLKAESAANIVVRLGDSEREYFQYKFNVNGGSWETIEVEASPGAESWGGSENKTIDAPIHDVWIGIQKNQEYPKGQVVISEIKTTAR